MQAADLEVIKEIPGYKLVLKAVLKHQIQQLVEQLADHTGEESVILTASVSDGSLSHLGTESGKIFLEDNDDIKSKFLGFCLKRHHGQSHVENQQSGPISTNKTITHSGQKPTPALRYSTPNQQSSPSVQTSVHPVSLTKVSQRGRKRHKPYVGSQTRRISLNVNQQEQTSEQQAFPMALPNQPGSNLTNDINTLETIKIEIDDEVEKLNSDSVSGGLELSSVLGNKSSSLSEEKGNDDGTTENESSETIAHGGDDLDSQSFNVRAAEENMSANKSVSSDKSVSNNGTHIDPTVLIKTEALESEMNLETIGVQSGQISKDIWMSNLQTLEAIEPGSSSQREKTVDQNELDSSFGLKPTDDSVVEKVSNQYVCLVCSFTTRFRQNLKRHEKKHKQGFASLPSAGRSYSETCDHCSKQFKTKCGLKLHVHTHHLHKFRFKCPVCSRGYNILSSYRGHMASHHQELKEKCSTCGATFLYKQSLKEHLKKNHPATVKKKHMCHDCNKEFSCRDTLIQHNKGIHSGGAHKCQKCGKLYRWRSSLAYHMWACH